MRSARKLQHDYLKPEDKRNTVHDSFYSSSAWRKTRKAFLTEFPLCLHCEEEGVVTPAKVVDHIVQRSKGGADFDWSNLQPLCARHHDMKSSAEGRESRYKKRKKS